jgi:hypothetical protein
VTRLITGYAESGRVKAAQYQRREFATRYTARDVELPAYIDKWHGNLSGPATKRILEREYSSTANTGSLHTSAWPAFQWPSSIDFRSSEIYRKHNASYQPTRPTPIAPGERRKPHLQGRPGFLRVDTVHQGDRDGRKGLNHINAVDKVTQTRSPPGRARRNR